MDVAIDLAEGRRPGRRSECLVILICARRDALDVATTSEAGLELQSHTRVTAGKNEFPRTVPS